MEAAVAELLPELEEVDVLLLLVLLLLLELLFLIIIFSSSLFPLLFVLLFIDCDHFDKYRHFKTYFQQARKEARLQMFR